jgi:hypothetical protein
MPNSGHVKGGGLLLLGPDIMPLLIGGCGWQG